MYQFLKNGCWRHLSDDSELVSVHPDCLVHCRFTPTYYNTRQRLGNFQPLIASSVLTLILLAPVCSSVHFKLQFYLIFKSFSALRSFSCNTLSLVCVSCSNMTVVRRRRIRRNVEPAENESSLLLFLNIFQNVFVTIGRKRRIRTNCGLENRKLIAWNNGGKCNIKYFYVTASHIYTSLDGSVSQSVGLQKFR